MEKSLLRRLDYLAPTTATMAGIVLGASVGTAVLLKTPSVVGVGVFIFLLGLAGVLAWSGEPIAVLEPSEAEPTFSVEMVPIPAGSFLMGSPDDEAGRDDNEGPVHEVSLSAFQCMRFPVTRRLYAQVTGKDPGWPEGPADERPVNNVSWHDAVRFCNQLSEKDGLEPCYQLDGDEVSWVRNADGYRLPTEAEWEYACRAGSQARWSCGEKEELLQGHAWYDENSDGKPRAVGEKQPNRWDLHDMHGNVWEWCWDWYGSYTEEPKQDPRGAADGQWRVLRGGSFAGSAGDLRSAVRVRYGPEGRGRVFGFRCVRVSGRQGLGPGTWDLGP